MNAKTEWVFQEAQRAYPGLNWKARNGMIRGAPPNGTAVIVIEFDTTGAPVILRCAGGDATMQADTSMRRIRGAVSRAMTAARNEARRRDHGIHRLHNLLSLAEMGLWP